MEKARILIVEDEAIVAMEIESSLQSLGYTVTSIADNGEKAIEKAEEEKPDLVLMDIRIKGEMDGIDAAEVIRSKFEIPVIFSTAYLDEERIERAKITIPFGYVLKPIQERDLKVTIEMALYIGKVDRERRKTEESLMISETRFKSLFNGMSGGVAVYEAKNEGDNFTFIDINKAVEKIEHVNKEEIIGRNVTEVFPGVKEFGLFDVFQRVWKTGTPEHHPISMYKDERIVGWRENFVYKLPTGEIVSVYNDITERKQAQEKRQQAIERLEIIMRSIQSGVIVIDAETRKIVDTNAAAEAMIGSEPEDIVGHICHQFICPMKQNECPILDEGQQVDNSECLLLRKDGTQLEILKNVKFITLDGRRCLIETFVDITERKQIEKELQKTHNELDQRVKERTSELIENNKVRVRIQAHKDPVL